MTTKTITTGQPIILHSWSHVPESFCPEIELFATAFKKLLQEKAFSRLTDTLASFLYKMTCTSLWFKFVERVSPALLLQLCDLNAIETVFTADRSAGSGTGRRRCHHVSKDHTLWHSSSSAELRWRCHVSCHSSRCSSAGFDVTCLVWARERCRNKPTSFPGRVS